MNKFLNNFRLPWNFPVQACYQQKWDITYLLRFILHTYFTLKICLLCVCERERGGQRHSKSRREREGGSLCACVCLSVHHVCVCVPTHLRVCVCVYLCVCVRVWVCVCMHIGREEWMKLCVKCPMLKSEKAGIFATLQWKTYTEN